jgi:hypothetical protein
MTCLEMKSPNFSSIRSVTILALFTTISGTLFVPAHAACEFAPVRQQIDNVLDKDAAKGAKFRREVAEGADSITTIEALVAAYMRDKVDICRFEVGEYLTKRGFPPFH